LYLTYKASPYPSGTDRQSLLDYYDNFPSSGKYKYIKPTTFKIKLIRRGKVLSRKPSPASVEEFGVLDDKVDSSLSDDEPMDSSE
jgi:hypothetical protein